jgi:tetratricopeptide (TPR) repeat protein
MPKYVTREESDIWGNDRIVTRREPTAYDVGSAIGVGLGMMVTANRNAKIKAAVANAEAAQQYLEKREYDKAIQSANSLIGTKDSEAQTIGHFFKATALEGLERADESIAEYSTTIDLARAINQTPSLAIAFIGRGRCYIQKNELGAAMRDFTAYIQMEPNEDIGYYWQALALQRLGDLDQALSNINRAITINPGDGANYLERASIYEKQNDARRAIEDLSRGITLDPQNATAYRRRGALYSATNDNQLAIADYSRAIELDPRDLESVKGRAAVYQRIGDVARYSADMAQVTREGPVQRAYNDYFKVANTAHNNGIRAIYTEADSRTKPNWGLTFVQVCLAIVATLGMGILASSMSRGNGLIGLAVLALLVLWPIAIVSGTITKAKSKATAAAAYLKLRHENEPRMPGFEEFFRQYLQAKNESRLQELPSRTRPFFENGPGSRVVLSYSS